MIDREWIAAVAGVTVCDNLYHQHLACMGYWLAVRAGVAGRRTERGDVLREVTAHLEHASDTSDEAAQNTIPETWLEALGDCIRHGEHLGAARRAEIAVMPREGER